ncbi:hypothetical protein CL617_03385 [archaeon]|nr:hypothetical protein [archaeon]|tara:strand:- start:3532 stop:4491 length:960 start_codon:yes stop_codon:yes gene_type:complete
MVLVTVIVPTFNRKEYLKKCLDSVYKQTSKIFEIIVIDNGSTDGSLEYLKKCKNLKVIENDSNLGASVARNQAIKISQGKYIWFLDSDAEAKSEDCLKNMINMMDNDSNLGEIGGEETFFDNKYQVRISNTQRNQDGVFIYSTSVKNREVDYIATSNCFVRKDLLISVGGFDPGYFYGYEDNDVGFLIRKLGYKNVIDDGIMAYHYIDKQTRLSNFFRFHKNRVRFLVKKENLLFLLFLPLIDVITTLKILPKRIEELKKRELKDIGWYNKEKKSKDDHIVVKVVKLGTSYSSNLFLAYLWNLAYLPKTLYTRRNNKFL